jgi:predicted component of type VI protein secretion system
MSHAPFVAAAGRQLFGIDSFTGSFEPQVPEGPSSRCPQYIKWKSFRVFRGFAVRGLA